MGNAPPECGLGILPVGGHGQVAMPQCIPLLIERRYTKLPPPYRNPPQMRPGHPVHHDLY
jgi:hypothetical protein